MSAAKDNACSRETDDGAFLSEALAQKLERRCRKGPHILDAIRFSRFDRDGFRNRPRQRNACVAGSVTVGITGWPRRSRFRQTPNRTKA